MTNVISNPFVDPTGALLQLLSNRRDRHASAVQAHGHATPLRISILDLCSALHTPPPVGGKYAALHNVLNTACVELHDVLNTPFVYDVLNTDNYRPSENTLEKLDWRK
jgi:hypothetical protein